MFAQKYKLRVHSYVYKTSSSLDHVPMWNGFLYVQHPNLSRLFQITITLCMGKKKDVDELLAKKFASCYSFDEILKLVCVNKPCVPWDELTNGYTTIENDIPCEFFSQGKYLFLDLECFNMKTMTCGMVSIGNGSKNVVLIKPCDLSQEMFHEHTVIMFDAKLDKKILATYGITIENVLDLQEVAKKIIGGDHWSLKTLHGFLYNQTTSNVTDLNESEWWHNTALKKYACADIVALMKCFDRLRFKKASSKTVS